MSTKHPAKPEPATQEDEDRERYELMIARATELLAKGIEPGSPEEKELADLRSDLELYERGVPRAGVIQSGAVAPPAPDIKRPPWERKP